ncbi:hypothetical protein ABEB36_011614 [Hypothenemus hampei]|uniref:Dedicator of cytokinesis protein 9 n=1 Tax=Hypothenemus hampei TaxID=57062 RepID=A0ABD1E972_HYPHA
MSERKFTRGLGKPGTAAQLRETVSQIVKESAVHSKASLVDPIDFEQFLIKHRTILQNDPQRELLLYPPDDISQVLLPRRCRTMASTIPVNKEIENCNLFTKQCIKTYTTNWQVVHFKYEKFAGGYLDLPNVEENGKLSEELYEVDISENDSGYTKSKSDNITKEGWLMRGPEIGSEKSFVNMGSKSFKKRYCYLRQEVDGTYILEMFKDEQKGEAKATIVMDFCTDVVKNFKRGRYCFELRMSSGHKSYTLAAENEQDLNDWLSKLVSVLQQNKIQEEKRAASLEREKNTPSSPPGQFYGTLRGLEQSMNPQLIKYARETDMSIAQSRKEKRHRLFLLFPPLAMNLKVATPNQQQDQPNQIEPFREIFGHRVFFKCESLKLKLQVVDEKDKLCQIEPYFTTLCLFDVKHGRKLTEHFHFDVNSDNIRPTPGVECGPFLPNVPSEWLLYPRQGIFNITNPHPDVFLFVRIEKVLQGSINQSSECYIKANKDPKIGLKCYKNIATYCQKLGKYRMPFAWTARPLYRLYSNELDTVSEFHAIYRQETAKMSDEEVLKLLQDYRKPDKFNKFTVIPGSLQIKITQLTDLPPNSLTPSLAPLKPFPLPPEAPPTIEVCQFESGCEKDVHPYTTFVNHLYIYPVSLNFDTQKTFTRARNICCTIEIRDSDNEAAKSLACIYGRPGQSSFVSTATCAVLHHNATPIWYEEVKIRLPVTVLYSHHVLFTFHHVSCNITKKRDNGVENCVGYAWMPLMHKGRLNVTSAQTLPVAAHLPPGYLSVHPFGLGKGNSGPDIQWIDGQKPIFTVNFNLVSTVNTRDQHLFNLFVHSEKLLQFKPSSIPSESETCKILKALHAIHLATLITFLPTLFNQLFVLLVETVSEEIGLNVIRVMINLVNMLCESNRKDVLNSYVKYSFTLVESRQRAGATVHEQCCKQLVKILDPNNPDFLVVNKFMYHSDFFFEIVVKNMTLHLLTTGRIKMQRHERFSHDYLNQLESLSHILIDYVLNKYKEMPVETKELNRSLAVFFKKCLSLLDRGFLFKLIKFYMVKFNPGDNRILQDFKFTFLEIICNHEHYVSFNLPIQCSRLVSPLRNKSLTDPLEELSLTETFSKHHFIVGLLLEEVRASLNEVPYIRRIALNIFRDLLAKHELDERYSARGQMERIALIYLPWFQIVLENFNRIPLLEEDEDHAEEIGGAANRISSSSSSYLFGAKSFGSECNSSSKRSQHHRFTLHLDRDSPLHMRNSAFFEAIAGQSLVNGHSLSIDSDISVLSTVDTSSQDTTIIRGEDSVPGGGDVVMKTNHERSHSSCATQVLPRYDKLHPEEVRDMLLAFLFIVKYLGEEHLVGWWRAHSETEEVLSFFSVLEACLFCFKYGGGRNVNLVKSVEGDNPKRAKSKRAHTLPARINPSEINDHENSSTLIIHTNRENLVSDNENQVFKKQQTIMEQNLATEVGLIVLDCLGLYSMHFRKKLVITSPSTSDGEVIKKMFDLHLTMIQLGQSDRLLKHLFAALRSFINNYSTIFYQGNATLCGKLCYELLKCCNSRVQTTRQEAGALLYLLMRTNFEFTNRKGLTRVHLQLIISVSQILGGDVVNSLNNARFQESLSLINSYAASDKAMKGSGFPNEVKDLTKRIRTVLMATVQMREHHQDPEMLVDLQHSLANSYASTPELRHTWLEAMTKHHVAAGNYSEAACCQLHIAASMAEYLKLKRVQSWGAEAFLAISSNIPQDEKGLKLDSGAHNDVHYTELSLLEQLEACAQFLDKAERYETIGELFKLIIPLYEKKRDFEQLKKCYQLLALNYAKVIECQKSGRRLLGRYYRVGVYGACFEDENGREYVYKEPKVTALSEISQRLEQLYRDKYGPDMVKLITESGPVNRDDLDVKFGYIQITHVTPYFETDEDREMRQTEFEQNHNVSTFMYETPFTKDGKAQGNVEEQWKRRTILTVSRAFPYVKKKIPVDNRKIVELNPIEVAIDEMRMRVAELEDVVFFQPTDAKKLQLRLQGSVCVQVNAGPLAYASAFLNPSLANRYPDHKVEELKDIYREFLKMCHAALQINGELVAQDQREYQEVLEQNYMKLCIAVSELLGESLSSHEDINNGSSQQNNIVLLRSLGGVSHNSSSA